VIVLPSSIHLLLDSKSLSYFEGEALSCMGIVVHNFMNDLAGIIQQQKTLKENGRS